ncbi:hypothetical protein [Nocardioides caldifontis]|uniref:hypothetical protein n=1 Tax=Nocardioides caldifontis TaxID=2588938 RepID=UPI0011DF1070|nr:hypothetical protein [Nocardioides caldifontis]
MASSSPAATPVERFRPTSGRFVGGASLVAAAFVLVLTAVTEPNLTGVRICLLVALAGVVVWAVLLRPRATAYDDTLVLHNQVSDWHLPLAKVDDVAVRHTLNVWVGGKRYSCPGIGRASRQMVRGSDGNPTSVFARRNDARQGGGDAASIGEVDYATFVENRIDELARIARRDGGEPPAVRRSWAVPELTAMAVLALAAVVAFSV